MLFHQLVFVFQQLVFTVAPIYLKLLLLDDLPLFFSFFQLELSLTQLTYPWQANLDGPIRLSARLPFIFHQPLLKAAQISLEQLAFERHHLVLALMVKFIFKPCRPKGALSQLKLPPVIFAKPTLLCALLPKPLVQFFKLLFQSHLKYLTRLWLISLLQAFKVQLFGPLPEQFLLFQFFKLVLLLKVAF